MMKQWRTKTPDNMDEQPRAVRRRGFLVGAATLVATALASRGIGAVEADSPALPAKTHTLLSLDLPPGYQIEKVVDGLTYATALTWDDQGRLYVAEAGGGFSEEPSPARILRVDSGKVTEVANLTNKGVLASVAGLYWYKGAFYFTHRDPTDRTDAVSRMTMDGTVTRILSGFPDGPSEHQANDIRVGPDGRMYLAVGPAGNSAVMGIDNAPNITRVPTVHTTPCVDYVLTGMNFETPDFRTPDQSDKVRTGAFVPFGTATTPGQKIPGAKKCGGAIYAFDPNNAEATLRVFAHGLRNVIGLTWNTKGEMFAAVNGYDVRGSRPVNDPFDATYRIREGVWYGWPDYSAALEPLTDPKFDVPDTLKVPIYVNGQLQPMKLGFVIDHAASRLTPPDRSLVYGLHEGDSSPSLLDVAPASWGDLAGQVFVAEWGDLAPGTNPLLAKPAGYRVSRIDPATGRAVPFVQNVKPGPASKQGAMGLGIERPFDVKFGPDGAMYIADYGVANVNMARIKEGKSPYEFPPQTGAIWKVTRMAGAPGLAPMPPAPAPPAPPAPPPSAPANVPSAPPRTGGGDEAHFLRRLGDG